jgi:hypothetical protein
MYSRDQSRISTFARANPENFTKVLQFVYLTIQNSLHRVPGDFETALEGNEEAKGILYSWKWEAFFTAPDHAEYTLSYLEHVYYGQGNDEEKSATMIEYLADLKGLGLVKAGFVTQLVYGLGGCLDTHNLGRFGLHERDFKGYKDLRTTKGRRAKVNKYVSAVYSLGGPSVLWDSWCTYVAAKQPRYYDSASEVSELHCKCLGL